MDSLKFQPLLCSLSNDTNAGTAMLLGSSGDSHGGLGFLGPLDPDWDFLN